MRICLATILIFFFLPPDILAQEPVIPTGMTLEYEITADIKVPLLGWVLNPLVGGKVGSGFIKITCEQDAAGQATYHVVAEGGSERVQIFEQAGSWFNRDVLAKKYTRLSTSKGRKKKYSFQYDRKKNQIDCTTEWDGWLETEFFAPPDVNDPLTGFFYLCQKDLKPGEVVFLNTHTDSTLEQAKIVVAAKETEMIGGKIRNLLRLEISSKVNIFQHQDKITIWVLRERNIPYRVKAKVPIVGLKVVEVEIKLQEDSLFWPEQ